MNTLREVIEHASERVRHAQSGSYAPTKDMALAYAEGVLDALAALQPPSPEQVDPEDLERMRRVLAGPLVPPDGEG